MAYSGSFRLNKSAAPDAGPELPAPAAQTPQERRSAAGGFPLDLGTLLKKTEVAGMDADDLLMAVVLYLLYRESGDMDLLIMLGVILLT